MKASGFKNFDGHLLIILGGGLVASSLDHFYRLDTRFEHVNRPPMPDGWECSDEIVTFLQEWIASCQPFKNISFVWATGLGSLNLDGNGMSSEERLLNRVVRMLARYESDFYVDLTFISSAGAIFAQTGRTFMTDLMVSPTNEYGRSKLAQEEQVIATLERYRIIRPTTLYGRNRGSSTSKGLIHSLLDSVMKNKPITIFGRPDTMRDYLYVDDCCRFIKSLIDAQSDNGIYLAASGQSVPIYALIQHARRITRRPRFQISYKLSTTNDQDIAFFQPPIYGYIGRTPLSLGMFTQFHTQRLN